MVEVSRHPSERRRDLFFGDCDSWLLSHWHMFATAAAVAGLVAAIGRWSAAQFTPLLRCLRCVQSVTIINVGMRAIFEARI